MRIRLPFRVRVKRFGSRERLLDLLTVEQRQANVSKHDAAQLGPSVRMGERTPFGEHLCPLLRRQMHGPQRDRQDTHQRAISVVIHSLAATGKPGGSAIVAQDGPGGGLPDIEHGSACGMTGFFVPSSEFTHVGRRIPSGTVEKGGDMGEGQGTVITPMPRRLGMGSETSHARDRISPPFLRSAEFHWHPAGIPQKQTKQSAANPVAEDLVRYRWGRSDHPA